MAERYSARRPPHEGRPQHEPAFYDPWGIVRIPVQILVSGVALAIVVRLWSGLGLPSPLLLAPAIGKLDVNAHHIAAGLAAVLVFASGLIMIAFLWWLAGRYFALIQTGYIKADVESLKDSPLALPEGTVRAVLALIVAVVGLPILLFSNLLDLEPDISGYINGIIAGVFGFYFGSRTQGIPAAAVNQIATSKSNEMVARTQAENSDKSLTEAMKSAEEMGGQLQASRAAEARARLDRHLPLLAELATTIGPALPSGLLPSGLGDLVARGQKALEPGGVLADLEAAGGALLRGSALGALLRAGAPVVGGSQALLALLLCAGWRAGSAEFQRWRAQVLGAPVSSFVIPYGTIGSDEVRSALATLPDLTQALAAAGLPDAPGLLAPLILRDNAQEVLWERLVADPLPNCRPAFSTREQLADALDDLLQAVLAQSTRHDIAADMVQALVSILARSRDPSLRPVNVAAPEVAAAAIAAGRAAETAPEAAQAAFDALVMLTGVARAKKIDLALVLSEIEPPAEQP